MLGYRGNKGFYLGSLSWDISLSWGIDVRRVSLLGYKDVYVYIYIVIIHIGVHLG